MPGTNRQRLGVVVQTFFTYFVQAARSISLHITVSGKKAYTPYIRCLIVGRFPRQVGFRMEYKVASELCICSLVILTFLVSCSVDFHSLCFCDVHRLSVP